jgi:hypothetical protein
MLSFTDLIAPIQASSVKNTLYMLMTRVGLDTTTWKVGSPIRTLTAALSVWNAAYTQWASNAIKLKFLQESSGDWLSAVAKFDWGTTRSLAQPAAGNVTFVNASTSSITLDPEDLTITYTKTNSDQSTSKYTYHNTATFTVAPSASTSSAIEADQVGFASTLPAGATVTLSPAITGLSVTVTSTLLGVDDESDQRLVNRAEKSTAAISPNGPNEAYEVVALAATNADGSLICGKCRVVSGNPVTLVVESPSGGVVPGDLNDITTPLGRLNVAIQTMVVPLGVTAVLQVVVQAVVAITYTAYVDATSSLSDDQIKGYIETSLDELFASYPIGGYVIPTALIDGDHLSGTRWIFIDSIKSAIQDATQNLANIVNPVIKVTVSTSSGTGDISVGATTQAVKGTTNATVVRT